MFHRFIALAAAVLLIPMVGGTAFAITSPTVLGDSIAPGVVTGVDGFGSSTVMVPKSTYVTYLVRTDSNLAGKRIEIWTKTGKEWKYTTARLVAKDGTVHYYARVLAWTGFWAKFAGDGSAPAGTSHGQIATVSSNGRTIIRATCSDFAPTGSGAKVFVQRTVGIRFVNAEISLSLCSNPGSTGFSWSSAAIDTAHLRLVGHSMSRAPRGSPVGAPGIETWTYAVVQAGVGRATLLYSQPWKGGEKAVWAMQLTVVASN